MVDEGGKDGPSKLVSLLWSFHWVKGPSWRWTLAVEGPFAMSRDQSMGTKLKGPCDRGVEKLEPPAEG